MNEHSNRCKQHYAKICEVTFQPLKTLFNFKKNIIRHKNLLFENLLFEKTTILFHFKKIHYSTCETTPLFEHPFDNLGTGTLLPN